MAEILQYSNEISVKIPGKKKKKFENSEEIKIGIYQPIYWIHWFLNQLISYSPPTPPKKKILYLDRAWHHRDYKTYLCSIMSKSRPYCPFTS